MSQANWSVVSSEGRFTTTRRAELLRAVDG